MVYREIKMRYIKEIFRFIRHIIKHYEEDKEAFLFIHYEQIYSEIILSKLSKFLNEEIKNDFVEKKLKCSSGNRNISDEAQSVYNKLLLLADYK